LDPVPAKTTAKTKIVDDLPAIGVGHAGVMWVGRFSSLCGGGCPVSAKSALSHLNRPITPRVSLLVAPEINPAGNPGSPLKGDQAAAAGR
jgi:hypothetical protein